MAPDRPTGDLPELLKRYVRQETFDPLRALWRFVGFGLAGAVLVAGGCLLLAVGALRLLQEWEALDGNWTWVPYLAASALLAGTAGFAASRIGRESGSSVAGGPRGGGKEAG
ncbi:MAG: hypothetical protein VYD11_06330 [Actinomycetota bacterium]|nr:hypothetical protein [Actinomycetota bacterium]